MALHAVCSPRMGERRHSSEKKLTRMQNSTDVAGLAALAICESPLLALNDRRILPENEIIGFLADAAAGHANAPAHDGMAETHRAVAALIQGIIDGGNSVRHRQS